MATRFLLLLGLLISNSAWTMEIDTLVARIDTRMQSFPTIDDLTYLATSRELQMDEQWQPKSIVTIEKQILRRGGQDSTLILKATEIADGKETDITEKTREQWRKRKNDSENNQGRMSMELTDLLPFSREKRATYLFSILADTLIDGRSLGRIRAEPRQASAERFTGIFTFDPETHTLLELHLRPSQEPRFVQSMNMRLRFQLLSDQIWLPRSFYLRVHAKIVIKNFRFEVQEDYTDFVLPAGVVDTPDGNE